jgi:hypothetical protein
MSILIVPLRAHDKYFKNASSFKIIGFLVALDGSYDFSSILIGARTQFAKFINRQMIAIIPYLLL